MVLAHFLLDLRDSMLAVCLSASATRGKVGALASCFFWEPSVLPGPTVALFCGYGGAARRSASSTP